jgi:phosphoribosylanthranilate isomerase
MLRIKICGITSPEEAVAAAEAGADAIGMVFAPSRRQISVNISREICRAVPPFVSKVGVFVNEEAQKVQEIANYCGLDTLQFHGSESVAYCEQFVQKVIKAFRIKNEESLDEVRDFIQYTPLLDSYTQGEMGGTGLTFKWDLAVQIAQKHKIILAGGLNENNVLSAIETVKPYAVDASSGIETNGKKDLNKIKRFINTIRRWEYHGK